VSTQALVLAFGTGMVATVNPCGFAMLPAYLSYFLGLDDPSVDSRASVLRAVGIGAVVTSGFVVVFTLIGSLVNVLALPISEHLPWFTLIIGVVLFGLGLAMLAGFQPSVALPKLERGGDRRTLWSMFVFGVSYAIASLSCTLPIFLANVVGVFTSASLLEGLGVFTAYALGMGLVLTATTVALALARQSLVVRLRTVMRHANRIAGALLVVAGGFLIYWGWWERQVLSGNVDAGGPADVLLDLQASVAAWVGETGATRIGLVLALFMGAALGLAVWRSSRPAT
jgi:cytochrome c-type biogenesis protein